MATPIGHLGDITLRALETLRAADRIVAEDTRRTRTLLSHFAIAGKTLENIDAHSTPESLARVIERIERGEMVAMVTDAGMPSVSDPGGALVARAIERGVPVVPIAGASAVTSAISVSALVDGPFRFVGFLPRTGGARQEALLKIAQTPEPVVLFESPSRIAETLRELAESAPNRPAMVAREMTKMHEELVRGTLAELSAVPREWMGEITVVLGHAPEIVAAQFDDQRIDSRIDTELAAGGHARTVADRVAAWSGRGRREIYGRVLERKRAYQPKT